jgi:UPF0716 protein FxsA
MWLLFLFVVVPAVELYLLVRIGSRVGVGATIGLIVVTGMVGWMLAKSQGLSTLRRIQAETAEGRLPALEMVSGLCLLGAGLLLITPGFLTDAVGFLMLIPPLRRGVARRIMSRFRVQVIPGSGEVAPGGGPGTPPGSGSGGGPGGDGEIIDIPPADVETYSGNHRDRHEEGRARAGSAGRRRHDERRPQAEA